MFLSGLSERRGGTERDRVLNSRTTARLSGFERPAPARPRWVRRTQSSGRAMSKRTRAANSERHSKAERARNAISNKTRFHWCSLWKSKRTQRNKKKKPGFFHELRIKNLVFFAKCPVPRIPKTRQAFRQASRQASRHLIPMRELGQLTYWIPVWSLFVLIFSSPRIFA